MTIYLRVWRQKNRSEAGKLVNYTLLDVSKNMSFLEMIDKLNNELVVKGDEPVAFEHDCREGICGMCSMVINGTPHGPDKSTTTCQLHMRSFNDGDTIVIEPFRAKAFPVIKDLVVERASFDRVIAAGGFISNNVGSAQDANSQLVPKTNADRAMDAAACIGCGACVAVCKNASAMLFVSAKVTHLAELPQGQAERKSRVLNMVEAMDHEGFGSCTNTGACSSTCPKDISLDTITKLNRDYLGASITEK